LSKPEDKAPSSASDLDRTEAMSEDQMPGLPASIGPYRVLSSLGEGGFGVVYLAEQTKPVRRRVALKVIKPGMDSAAVVARFEAERQALAVMDHPCVARVFDAGTTPEGRPYFVMEHVKGVPITEHCDRQRLAVRQRIELFIQVCEAVQHAHMKGVIHRDLKPSNILVEYREDSGGVRITPKVIDFGVAKSLDRPLTDKTLYTAVGELIGTPEYMSPEQAGTSGQDIDTRADIYALGVVLYELLVGQPPFDVDLMRRAGLGEVLRILHEVDPPRPSTRLSAAGARSSGAARGEQATATVAGQRLVIAERRRTDVRSLRRVLKGDLDWIIMKCLEKDRARRYETANALAMDLRRYLRHEPVLAGPPGAAYRMGKFIRRHRVPMAAVGGTTLALLAGVVGIALALNEAQQQRVAAEQARTEATQRALELERVAEFQSSLLGELDPERIGQALWRDMTIGLEQAVAEQDLPPGQRDDLRRSFESVSRHINPTDIARRMLDETLLARAVLAIDREFGDQPLVEAALRQTVGEVYSALGLYSSALAQLERAHSIRSEQLGKAHLDTLGSHAALGLLLLHMDRLDDALMHLQTALEGFRQSSGAGDAQAVRTAISLAVVLRRLNRLDEAQRLVHEAHQASLEKAGPADRQTLAAVDNLGVLYQMAGDWQQAENYFRQALDGRLRTLGEYDAETLMSYQNVGLIYWAQFRLDEAEPNLQSALRLARRIHGEDHPTTLQVANSLGALLHTQDRNEEAERVLTRTLELYRRVLGHFHYETLNCLANLASVLHAQGRLDVAEQAFREAIQGLRVTAGDNDRLTLIQMSNLASLLADNGDLEAAESYLTEAVDRGLQSLGEVDDVLIWINNLSSIKRELGRLEEALLLADQAVNGARESMPPVFLGRFQMSRARVFDQLGRHAEATQTMEEAYVLLAELIGPSSDWAVEAATALVEFYHAWAIADPDGAPADQADVWQAKTVH
jgi:eukaryotic-like serine/threonine-protein kinase